VTLDPVSRALDRWTEHVEQLHARVAELELEQSRVPAAPVEERRAAS
jgi:hypothetical protein